MNAMLTELGSCGNPTCNKFSQRHDFNMTLVGVFRVCEWLTVDTQKNNIVGFLWGGTCNSAHLVAAKTFSNREVVDITSPIQIDVHDFIYDKPAGVYHTKAATLCLPAGIVGGQIVEIVLRKPVDDEESTRLNNLALASHCRVEPHGVSIDLIVFVKEWKDAVSGSEWDAKKKWVFRNATALDFPRIVTALRQ
jgi:hypothetical protein